VYNNVKIRASTIVRNTIGYFDETKRMAVIEAIINIVLSLSLVHFLGITGVLLGSVVAKLSTNQWYMPYITDKRVFGHFRIRNLSFHLKNMVVMVLLALILDPVNGYFEKLLPISGLGYYLVYALIMGVIVAVAVTLLFLLAYPSFKGSIQKVLRNLKSLVHRRRAQT